MNNETKTKLLVVVIMIITTTTLLLTIAQDRTISATTTQVNNIVPDPCGLSVVECAGEKQLPIQEYIKQEATKAGIDPQLALDIAECESNFDPYAKNPVSTAKGIYQWTNPTWEYIGANGHQFDQYENVDQFIKHYPKNPQWWAECLQKLSTN